jgi:hypothetical protein
MRLPAGLTLSTWRTNPGTECDCRSAQAEHRTTRVVSSSGVAPTKAPIAALGVLRGEKRQIHDLLPVFGSGPWFAQSLQGNRDTGTLVGQILSRFYN